MSTHVPGPATSGSAAGTRRRGTQRALAAAAVVVAALLAWWALGTPGGDGGDDDSGDGAVATPVTALTPDEFAERTTDPDASVVNVHIPYEGELAGTDAFIPYDEIAGDAGLPADEDTEILLYCLSGNMSETAARTLEAAGYTNVAHLEGGMQAWAAAGRAVLQDGT